MVQVCQSNYQFQVIFLTPREIATVGKRYRLTMICLTTNYRTFPVDLFTHLTWLLITLPEEVSQVQQLQHLLWAQYRKMLTQTGLSQVSQIEEIKFLQKY